MSNTAQRSFAAGEITPSLWARTDVAKYAISLRTCRNFVIMRHGGASYRPGLAFCEATKDSSVRSRLIKFVFSITDALVMEFGNQYIRFTQNGAPITVSGVAAWNSGTAYVIGNLVSVAGTNYYCIFGNTNHTPPNATYWYPLTGNIYEIPTPYGTADVQALNVVQQGDVVTMVHPLYPQAELKRFSNTDWTYTPIVFAPSIGAPSGVAATGTGSSGPHTWQYAMTAVSDATGEESLPDAPNTFYFFADPTAAAPHVITCTAVAGCTTYNVYVGIDLGVFGFLGSATIQYSSPPTFKNTGEQVPDFTTQPPQPFSDFTGAGNYPSVVGFYQQRAIYAGTLNQPARVWASATGHYHYFNQQSPIVDSSPIVFTIASDEIDAIEYLTVLGKLIIGTQAAEWLCDGDPNGTLTPTSVNARIGSYNGSSALRPVKVGSTVLYVQAIMSAVLALKTNVLYGYYTFADEDLTLESSHLFKGFTVTDWDYQKTPNYTVWVVRSDGVLLSLTYLPEQQLVAWAHHDTDGLVENVCCIPEATEDAVYVIVNRTINGSTARYIERLAPFDIVDPVNDPMFVDAGLEYDGRNAGGGTITMTLSGTGWTYTDPLTLTASAAFFTSGMATAPDVIVLHGSDGTILRFTIQTYTDTTHVIGFVDKDVPVSMQAVAITLWDHAVPAVGGLSHLEGETVSVYADGYVVASPNNSAYATPIVVTGGIATLPSAYTHIWVGLPFIGDLETLDIDTPQGQSLKDTKIAITRVGLYAEASRGGFVGRTTPDPTDSDPLDGMDEIKFRSESDDMNEPPPVETGYLFANIQGSWNKTGRVAIRQVDPIPMSVLAILPQGFIPPSQ